MLRLPLELTDFLIPLALVSPQAPSGIVVFGPSASGEPSASIPDPTIPPGTLIIDRGEGRLPISIPPNEELRFDVQVDLGILGDVGVGTVTLTTGIEEYRPGLPLPGPAPAATGQKAAWMKSYAEGGHLGYDLRHELVTRILPQE